MSMIIAPHWFQVSSAFSAAVTLDSPFLWWRMGETSGTTLSDNSGNSRPAVISGTAGTSYQLNQASLVNDTDPSIKLLADTGYIRSTNTYSFVLTNWSECIAFMADSGAGAGVLTMINQNINPDTGTGGRDRGFVLGSDGKLYFTFWDGSVSRRIASLSTVNDGVRRIAHVTISATVTKFFIDGVLQGSLTAVPAFTAATYLFVGRTNATDQSAPINTNAGFRGVVDELVYFTAALSDARVLAHAQAAGLA